MAKRNRKSKSLKTNVNGKNRGNPPLPSVSLPGRSSLVEAVPAHGPVGGNGSSTLLNESAVPRASLARPAETQTGANGRRPPSLNALKHGLRARTLLLSEEEAPLFEALREALLKEWAPQSNAERLLVIKMAEAAWRLRRIAPIEAQLFESLRDPEAPGGGYARAFLSANGSSALMKLMRYETALEREFHRALRALLLLQKCRGAYVPDESWRQSTDAEDEARARILDQIWHPEVGQAEALPSDPAVGDNAADPASSPGHDHETERSQASEGQAHSSASRTSGSTSKSREPGWAGLPFMQAMDLLEAELKSEKFPNGAAAAAMIRGMGRGNGGMGCAAP
jgi:hypothetical protein